MAIQTQLQSQFDFMKQREAEQTMPSFDYDALYHKNTQRILRTLRKPRRTRAANPAKYRAFLADIGVYDQETDVLSENGGLYNPIDDFSRFADEKRSLLRKHFPYRYGIQEMENYEGSSIGSLFNNFVEYAKQRVEEDKRRGKH